MMIYFAVCTLAAGLVTGPVSIKLNTIHLIGLGAGLAGAVGFVYFFIALSRGPASTVIPITSLYVAVASMLALLLLSEPITLKKALGIACAVVAVILLSG
jgi:transporter family protein